MTQAELLNLLARARDEGWKKLDLRWREIENIPPEIGNLTELEELQLGWQAINQNNGKIVQGALQVLPPEIRKLQQLKHLICMGNWFQTIPSSICQLLQLTKLDLGVNRLVLIPDSIAQLSKLTSLVLSYNQLKSIPNSIGQLSQLTYLSIGNNQLKSIPDSIGKLTKLTELYLDNNQVNKLPESLLELLNLEKLHLEGNPLPIPPEILNSGDPKTIFKFAFTPPNEKIPLYEAKLILVGDGGAGKTTLANKLQNPDYELTTTIEDYDWTRGIDILPWEIQHPSGHPYRVNIWDFGGQDIYHTTHQFFLSSRSVYVLVHDNRQGKTDFQYWLETIRLLGSKSPIIIVKNQKGDCTLDESAYQIDNLDNVTIHTTNLATGEGFAEAQQTIEQALNRLDRVGDPLPLHWAKIRDVLQNLAEAENNYIDEYDYFKYCEQQGFSSRQEMRQASAFFHELGICLHFQNEHSTGKTSALDRILILKPQWATDEIYKIYDDEDVRNHCGQFDTAKLDEIWDTGDSADRRLELLDLMKKFKLCYEIDSDRRDRQTGRYIAPTFLPIDPPDYDWDDTDNLRLRYDYPFKPKRIFQTFIVAAHHLIDRQLVWRHGVVLQDPNSDVRAEIIEDPEHREAKIRIRVAGKGDKRRLLQRIAENLESIQNHYGNAKQFEYQTSLPCICPQCQISDAPAFHNWAEVEEYRNAQVYEKRCPKYIREIIDVRRLIDNVAPPRVALPDDERKKYDPDARSSPFQINNYINANPQQTTDMSTNITQTHSGSGDNVAGNKNTTITNNPSPAETAELLKTLLKDLDLSNNSDRDDLKDELLYQPPAQQNKLWDWMDTVIRNADTRDEAIKTFAEVLGSLFGLPGTITAGAFKVCYTALTKARSKRNELPAGYEIVDAPEL
jgi:internalin A